MMTSVKRSLYLVAAIGTATLFAHTEAAAQTKLKMILDWKYQGQMAIYFLAADRGYFKDEGLDISFDQGEGAGAAAPKVATGAYDIGFGSLDSVIALQATRPAEAPVAVFQAYNRSPFVIALRSESPIKTPKDLEGRTIGGPIFDGALKLFPTFAKIASIDASKVTVTNMAPNLRAQMLMRSQIDGAFAFYTGIFMDTKLLGANPDSELRFIRYEDHGMDLYSNTIMVSKALTTQNPDVVKGFIRALNRGIKDAQADRAAGIAAVLKREALLNAKIERERFDLMYSFDMSAPEMKDVGLGDWVDSRVERNIRLIVEANSLPRSPSLGEVIDRRFLPPAAERIKQF
jgi:NitT/TauT family transport system substrate-binding protein